MYLRTSYHKYGLRIILFIDVLRIITVINIISNLRQTKFWSEILEGSQNFKNLVADERLMLRRVYCIRLFQDRVVDMGMILRAT